MFKNFSSSLWSFICKQKHRKYKAKTVFVFFRNRILLWRTFEIGIHWSNKRFSEIPIRYTFCVLCLMFYLWNAFSFILFMSLPMVFISFIVYRLCFALFFLLFSCLRPVTCFSIPFNWNWYFTESLGVCFSFYLTISKHHWSTDKINWQRTGS